MKNPNAPRDQTHRTSAAEMLQAAGVVLRADEASEIEIADFGLGDFERQGLALVIYANNDRYCAKELVLLPHQTCPEHRHPTVTLANGSTAPGKLETFFCRWGEVMLFVEGDPSPAPRCAPPTGNETAYTVGKQIILRAGEQYTIAPDTLHWFQAGERGAIVSEFSSTSRDELDIFTDPHIRRVPIGN